MRALLICLPLLLVLVLAPWSAPASSEKFSELIEAAERDQASGAYRDGFRAAQEAFDLAEQVGNPTQRTTARNVRASLLMATGDIVTARKEFEAVLKEGASLRIPELVETAHINLGNANAEAGSFKDALVHYRAAYQGASARNASGTMLQASLNWFRAEVESVPSGTQTFESENFLFAILDGRVGEGATALQRIHAARSLERAIERGVGNRRSAFVRANAMLRQVLASSSGPEEIASRAQALGYLGALYAEESRFEEALVLSRRAIRQASQLDSDAALYPWHLQAAEMLVALGREPEALADYTTAIRLIETHGKAIRRHLASSSSQRLGGVTSSTAPRPAGREQRELAGVYRNYVDLLLKRARGAETEEARRADLFLAQSTLEQLKGNELQDYFEDDCVLRYREKLQSVGDVGFEAMVIYPFLLEDRLELLVSHGGRLSQVVVDADRAEVEQTVADFRRLLEKRTTRQYRRPSERLYDWMIRPLEPMLEAHPPKTIVFVPDGVLRTIPMAALHDGKQFLIERFALGLTPGLELTDPRPVNVESANALFAGISESVQGFAALPNVEREINALHGVMGGDLLLNEGFSKGALGDEFSGKSYGIVHIASHAEFSEDAGGGFLLTHDGALSLSDFSDVVGLSKFREQPLEMLILSACETAGGSERAALGLSGVAIKAGAQSALGSLWRVNDEATADFMLGFYETLRKPGQSRADAARAGQRQLLAEPAYRHPYYWSPFLLINSWL